MGTLHKWLGHSLLVLVCFVAYSCNHSCPFKQFTEEAKSYFLNLKVGDYWIYKNIYDGDLDSVYVVSQTIMKDEGTGDPTCYQEYAFVILKGFAGDQLFSYQINSWSGEFDAILPGDLDYNGKYNLRVKENLTFNTIKYPNVLTLTHCCFSTDCRSTDFCCAGSSYCQMKAFRMRQFYVIPNIGIVSWEVENYPGKGNVVYDLLRTNRH